MGLISSIQSPSPDVCLKKWNDIPLEIKLDIFKFLDRISLDTYLLVSRDSRKFIDENSHLLGKHVIINFFIQTNGEVSLTWLEKKNKYSKNIVTYKEFRNTHILQLEIAELDDEKVNLLERITQECENTLTIKSLHVCLFHEGAFSIISLRKLFPHLIFNVVKAIEVGLEISSGEVSRLALTQTSLSRMPNHTKFFNLKLECFQDNLNRLINIFENPQIEFMNRETITVKYHEPIIELMERLLQTFNNHQNPGLLFHRTVIRSQYIAQNAIKTFAAGHLFVEKENDTFMFKRADGWVLEIFRTEALVMVFHIAYPDENGKCVRCHNYYSFNFL